MINYFDNEKDVEKIKNFIKILQDKIPNEEKEVLKENTGIALVICSIN
jgi:acetone carboxylase gamma subunit